MYEGRYLLETRQHLMLALQAASYAGSVPAVYKQVQLSIAKVDKAIDRYRKENRLPEYHFNDDF